MVPYLRSLCLTRVISLGLPVESLPLELVKDLMKVKLFNGSFSPNIHLTCLTIQYDGVSWLFKSRCISFPNFCCFNCSTAAYLPEADPEPHQFSLTEGEIINFNSTFSEVRSWVGNLISSEFPIKMSVVIDREEGTFGILRFHGSSEGVSFESNLHVEVTKTMNGFRRRVMFCGAHIVTDPNLYQEMFFVILNESEVPAEEALAFSNIDTTCHMGLDEYYSQDFDDALFGFDYWEENVEDGNSSKDSTEEEFGKSGFQEDATLQEDCLVEFWHMSNLNAVTGDNNGSESNL